MDNYSDDSSIGPLVEVDVDHPDEMHDLHNHCTLAAEKIKVATEIPSKYQLLIRMIIIFLLVKNGHLIPNLGNKRKYMLHYQNLQELE